MARLLLFLYQLSARWPKGLKTKEEPTNHRRDEAVEAINSYEDDDPAELDPPLPPDDGHEYRSYRVGRNPVCSRPLTRATFYRFARVLSVASPPSVLCPGRMVVRCEPELIASFSTCHPPLPKTFKDAMASPKAKSWYAASVKELNSMGLHKVFKLSRLPTGALAERHEIALEPH